MTHVEPNGSRRRVARVYDRVARIYDVYTAPMEWTGLAGRRQRVLGRARGDVLEVGAGTGRSFRHYPPGVRVVATELSPRMLARARRRLPEADVPIDLQVADVQDLPFEDRSFDTAVASCVFCSVDDPVRGLSELGRVVKLDGTILLLEHVRPRGAVPGWLADVASVVTRRVFGFNANRRTEENVLAAGLDIEDVRRHGIWREIVARPRP